MKIAYKEHMEGGNQGYEVDGPYGMAPHGHGWVHIKGDTHQGGAYSN